jgi:hypothetical protein
MQKTRRIYLATLGAIGLLVFVINPLLMLLVSFSLIMFLAVSRQLNYYKVAMMIKRYAKDVFRLRLEIRAKLHSGFKDCNGSMENEESNNRSYGFVR